jgi:hypothetical protein
MIGLFGFFLIGVMLLAFFFGFQQERLTLEEKKLSVSIVWVFYVVTSAAYAYLLYLQIRVSGLFHPETPLERFNYVLLWFFFIRQPAVILLSVYYHYESPWGIAFLTSRIIERHFRWTVLIITLIVATVLYLYLLETYAVRLKAVVFSFIYGSLLLYALDGFLTKKAQSPVRDGRG